MRLLWVDYESAYQSHIVSQIWSAITQIPPAVTVSSAVSILDPTILDCVSIALSSVHFFRLVCLFS